MYTYIIKRLLYMVPLIIGVTMITFLIMHLAPGNPLDALADPNITDVDAMREAEKRLGFDQPVYIQYLRWSSELLRGNFGYSYLTGHRVSHLIIQRLPPTLVLAVSAIILSHLVAIPIGILSALRRHSWLDRVFTTLSFGGISFPNFFACLLLSYLFAIRWGLFPTSGYGTIGFSGTRLSLLFDRLPYLVLPTMALAIRPLASVVRYVRSSMLDVLSEDYIRTARSKGLSERTVIYRHALRNSLMPVITLLGLTLPVLFGGAYVVEYIFDWPGMGTLGIRSLRSREYSIVMAINLVTALLVLTGSLVADIMYAVVDPRIRIYD